MALLGSGSLSYEVSGEDWGNLPEGWTYKEATAVAVDSKDNVYVFNRGTQPMVVFDRDGNFLRAWGGDIFTLAHGVSVGPDDSIYCADSGDHTVRKMSSEGEVLLTLGTKGEPAPPMSGRPLCRPTHLAVDRRNGDLFVSDGYSNARVHHYTPDGELVGSWGESGTGPGQMNIVHNLAIDDDGWIYVADRENRRIQVFDTEGNLEAQWANLSRAATVCVDHQGLVYVGEYYAGIGSNVLGTDLGPRVTIFDTQGNVRAKLGRESYGDQPGGSTLPTASPSTPGATSTSPRSPGPSTGCTWTRPRCSGRSRSW